MMLRQAQTSEPRALPRFAPARPRTASRANPPFVRNLPPHVRANARFAYENRRQYGNPASSGSVVANDPINAIDPTGEDTEISLRSIPLRGVGGLLGYRHAYVVYRDTETGEERITRAGPSVPYEGASSGAVSNEPSANGATVLATDTPAGRSADRPEVNPGTRTLRTATVEMSFDEVRSKVGRFNEEINNAATPYQPQTNNSNRYAGDAFEMLTGVNVDANPPSNVPGMEGDLPRRMEPR